MKKSFQFRIYPNKNQEVILNRTLSTCRHLYNEALAERKRESELNELQRSFGVFPWGKPEWINYYNQAGSLIDTKTSYQKEVFSQFVNARNTSQNCSGCHYPVPKDLSKRVHSCPFCNLVLDRDHNAAINILRRSISTVGTTGINARQVLLNRGSMQREAPPFRGSSSHPPAI